MMHHALPPRKSSIPKPYQPRPPRKPLTKLSQPQKWIIILITFTFAVWYLFGRDTKGAYFEPEPYGGPPVVIVTVTDPQEYSQDYVRKVKENREQYAAMHGYNTFIVPASDYDTSSDPKSWAKLMAIRHALSKYPNCGHIWFLDQNALIMEPRRSLEDQVLDTKVLEEVMQPDMDVVPGSIIKTFSHLQAEDASLLISQDARGLITDSMIIRNGEWAKFFLEQWLDPLYRSYKFEKAERHALEHSVQWHPTVLSKVAVVPQKLMAPYLTSTHGMSYKEGDFVVIFDDCSTPKGRSCAEEMDKFWARSKTGF